MLSRYLVDVAQTFNKFYNELPILVEDEELKASRIAIAKATSFIIKKGLSLLGINAPSKM